MSEQTSCACGTSNAFVGVVTPASCESGCKSSRVSGDGLMVDNGSEAAPVTDHASPLKAKQQALAILEARLTNVFLRLATRVNAASLAFIQQGPEDASAFGDVDREIVLAIRQFRAEFADLSQELVITLSDIEQLLIAKHKGGLELGEAG